MVIGFPHCTFKCEKDCGMQGLCQNSALVNSPDIKVDVQDIIFRYMTNPLSQSIVCAGLEPFDSFQDLLVLIASIRSASIQDDIVIYTGYNKSELENQLLVLSRFKNIVVKFGRFIPNQEKHYDEILGVYLASNNQYAERIS